MFGYIRPYLPDLTEAEKVRYRSVYCGVCRSLDTRYGLLGRISLNYDMTFLALFLSSLYEPEESHTLRRCAPHPLKTHEEAVSLMTDYAADMTIALTYHKCLDDWLDERKYPQKAYSDLIRRHYDSVRSLWPVQCASIEECIARLSAIETSASPVPDEAVRCSSLLMSRLFVPQKDFWEKQLTWFGASLGRFIYLMDAAMDYEHDRKKGCFNPLLIMNIKPEHARPLLMQPLDDLSEAFESLPLVQDDRLLRNILYSGLWQAYNEKMKKKTEGAAHDP